MSASYLSKIEDMVRASLDAHNKPDNAGRMHGRVYAGQSLTKRELRSGADAADLAWEDDVSASVMVSAFVAWIDMIEAESTRCKVWLEVWGGKSGGKKLSPPCLLEIEAPELPQTSMSKEKDEVIRTLREQLVSERAANSELQKLNITLSNHLKDVQVEFHKKQGFERDAAIFQQGQESIRSQLVQQGFGDKLEDLGVKVLDKLADQLLERVLGMGAASRPAPASSSSSAPSSSAPSSSAPSSSAPSSSAPSSSSSAAPTPPDEPADLLTFRRILDRLETNGYSQAIAYDMATYLNAFLQRTMQPG